MDENIESNPRDKGKLLSLKEAVTHYVKPGMRLHLAGGIGGYPALRRRRSMFMPFQETWPSGPGQSQRLCLDGLKEIAVV